MSENTNPLLLSVPAVARELSMSRRTVYRLIETGELPAIRLTAGTTRIAYADLLAFIEQRRVAA